MNHRAWRDNCRRLTRIAVLVVAADWRAGADNWPQFRGPNGSGVSLGTRPLPAEFSLTRDVRWSAELGEGVCSPTIVAGRAFSTAMRKEPAGGSTFVVYGLDAATGRELWRREFPAGDKPLPPIQEVNSYASATPAADADRVYVYFARFGQMALDARDGGDVWKQAAARALFHLRLGPGHLAGAVWPDAVLLPG